MIRLSDKILAHSFGRRERKRLPCSSFWYACGFCFFLCNTSLLSRYLYGSRPAILDNRCIEPSLLIVVLTCCRATSLQRLLTALSNSKYGCASVDLHINIDLVRHNGTENFDSVVSLARSLVWTHGSKTIRRQYRARSSSELV